MVWSEGSNKQGKSAEDAILVRGRKPAAIGLLRYLSSPNAAANKLQAQQTGSGVGHPGWMKKTTVAAAGADKEWDFRAFADEPAAKAFLDTVKPKKK